MTAVAESPMETEHALKGVADPQRMYAVLPSPPLHRDGEGAGG
jgi:hypothetical protein